LTPQGSVTASTETARLAAIMSRVFNTSSRACSERVLADDVSKRRRRHPRHAVAHDLDLDRDGLGIDGPPPDHRIRS
jgi:hypothetical protein